MKIYFISFINKSYIPGYERDLEKYFVVDIKESNI